MELWLIQSIVEIGNLIEPVPNCGFAEQPNFPSFEHFLSVGNENLKEVIILFDLLVPVCPNDFGNAQASVLDGLFLGHHSAGLLLLYFSNV